jgi:hypothetical protein
MIAELIITVLCILIIAMVIVGLSDKRYLDKTNRTFDMFISSVITLAITAIAIAIFTFII